LGQAILGLRCKKLARWSSGAHWARRGGQGFLRSSGIT